MFPIYQVYNIKTIDQLKECPVFHINHFNWTKEYRPKAFGQMALLDGYGFVVALTAIETDPLRRYVEDGSPVYKDSCLEAFLNFAPENLDKGYLNFEMNANGALLNGFGSGRGEKRKDLKEFTPFKAICEAKIEEDSWNVLLKIPMELVCDIYQIEPLKEGDGFTCNFYKTSDEPAIQHYASYSPIDNPTPNFHLPVYFGKVMITNFK